MEDVVEPPLSDGSPMPASDVGAAQTELLMSASAETISRVSKLRAALNAYHAGDPAWIVDVSNLAPPDLHVLHRLLGRGDISIMVDGSPGARIDASAFPGVWRAQYLDDGESPLREVYEVVDVPSLLTDAFSPAAGKLLEGGGMKTFTGKGPELESVVMDLENNVRRYRPGYDTRIINLSFLAPDDPELLDLERELGQGPVTIVGTGHQRCRVVNTALKNVWWAKYYNPAGQLALNVLEIVDIPLVARVTQKELIESAERIRKLLAAASD